MKLEYNYTFLFVPTVTMYFITVINMGSVSDPSTLTIHKPNLYTDTHKHISHYCIAPSQIFSERPSASDRYTIKQHLFTQQWEAIRSKAAQMEPDTLNSGSNGPITGCNFSAFISFPACFVFPRNNGASNGNSLQIMGGILTLRSVSWWFVVTREKTRAACGSLKSRLEMVNVVMLHASAVWAVIAL